jgi:hypothetical protein
LKDQSAKEKGGSKAPDGDGRNTREQQHQGYPEKNPGGLAKEHGKKVPIVAEGRIHE